MRPKPRLKRKRLYTAEDMADGVRTISALSQKAIEYGPPPEQVIPTHEGYCMGCKAKKTFQIESEEPHKNGALHRKGACPDCGRTISAFSKGTKDAA